MAVEDWKMIDIHLIECVRDTNSYSERESNTNL